MSIDKSAIQSVATLARLTVDDKDVAATTDTISQILELVGVMQAVNTDHIAPLSHPLDAVQRLRRDDVTETDKRDTLLACAPSVQDGLFLVPRVIE
ncbi:Glutamyl-tRNA(Gln) amidotransferase subunit C [invertebrate metagenome]|uniref:Glutamyl-tRNA(Gln) amidotransferase subunit C n=1 Tax=invertebrate metagenome TaxID=1711999 RepID=A0A2H9T9V2_9ZZZZ